jgi:hypothetical protein
MPWRCMVEWKYCAIILDLDSRWRLVVSFTPPVFTVYVGRWAAVSVCTLWNRGEFLSPAEVWNPGRPARSPSLYQLSCHGSPSIAFSRLHYGLSWLRIWISLERFVKCPRLRSQYFLGGTEEKHDMPDSGWPVCGLGCEHETSWIRIRRTAHLVACSLTTFNPWCGWTGLHLTCPARIMSQAETVECLARSRLA